MKVADIRLKTDSELKDMVIALKKEQMNFRFRVVSGNEVVPSRMRITRREVAQIKTVMNERRRKSVGEK